MLLYSIFFHGKYWLFDHFAHIIWKNMKKNILKMWRWLLWVSNILISLFFCDWILQSLPFCHPPSTADRIINIRELNSCLAADVCCCCTLLSAPGGERSAQGCRVKPRFSQRPCMSLHWQKNKTNKWASACPLAIDSTRLKLALLIAAVSLI